MAKRSRTMTILKVTTWRPDTHPGHIAEFEREYNRETGRSTERQCRGVSVRYPDGTHIHRDTHGADVAHEHYKKLAAENRLKNRAYNFIVDALPVHLKKPMFDSDGDSVLDIAGQPILTVKDKHKPGFKHLGNGRYEFTVPGLDEAAHRDLAAKLTAQFGDSVVLLSAAS